MKGIKFLSTTITLSMLVLTGCMSDSQFKEKLAKALKDDPKLLTDAIEANPADIITSFQKAVKDAQKELVARREQDEVKALEENYTNPLKPKIRDDESIRGTKGGPLVLVEYSDFECPFCTRGFNTVLDVMKKYPGKVQFIYKHLPLSFHKQAMVASQYYEAIRLQSDKKAFDFHDAIFKDQKKLKNGEKFLKKIAKKVGANMTKLAKDIGSEAVKKRIDEDLKEAAKFGMQGTPGFILNGIPVRGAYPVSHFEKIVDELKKRGMVKF